MYTKRTYLKLKIDNGLVFFLTCAMLLLDHLVFIKPAKILHRREEGQPQQFLVRATSSSFSRPSHLKILILPTDRYAFYYAY